MAVGGFRILQQIKKQRKLTVLIGLIGLMIAWWNQPHFGHSFCVTKGLMSDVDFVEELRPLIISFAKESRSIRLKDGGKQRRGSPDNPVLEDGIDGINKAFDLMKKCVAERGIEYCRYVGPKKNQSVIRQQDPNRISNDEKYKYRYIVEGSDVEMSILPWGDMPGSTFQYNDLKNKLAGSAEVASLGCGFGLSNDGGGVRYYGD